MNDCRQCSKPCKSRYDIAQQEIERCFFWNAGFHSAEHHRHIDECLRVQPRHRKGSGHDIPDGHIRIHMRYIRLRIEHGVAHIKDDRPAQEEHDAFQKWPNVKDGADSIKGGHTQGEVEKRHDKNGRDNARHLLHQRRINDEQILHPYRRQHGKADEQSFPKIGHGWLSSQAPALAQRASYFSAK